MLNFASDNGGCKTHLLSEVIQTPTINTSHLYAPHSFSPSIIPSSITAAIRNILTYFLSDVKCINT